VRNKLPREDGKNLVEEKKKKRVKEKTSGVPNNT